MEAIATAEGYVDVVLSIINDLEQGKTIDPGDMDVVKREAIKNKSRFSESRAGLAAILDQFPKPPTEGAL